MSERWTAVDGQLVQPDGWSAGHMHDRRLSADIAARLNGPSPAEVAALLRALEWRNMLHGERNCPGCSTPEGYAHESDCALDAMIRKCEGA